MHTNKGITVVLTGGGTGGHIYPAVAVAQILKSDPEIAYLYYIGCNKNIEKDIIAKENIDFYSVNISGMPRKFSWNFIFWIVKLICATIKAAFYLYKLQPDVVFGTGGYVTAPVLLASWIFNVPYIIHDPDAHPGIVNRRMASGATLVSLAFEQAKKYMKAKNIKILGNPIRASLSGVEKKDALKALGLNPDKKTILVIGGSQGAKTINSTLKNTLNSLIDSGFQVIHQTGQKNYDEYIKDLPVNIPEYIVKPYFDDMSIPLNAADIAISRAGSLSISELNLCGLPSILVPYPYAAANHQYFNAKAMEETGASVCIEDSNCTSDNLINAINLILSNYDSMREANLKLAQPNAAINIVQEIKKTAFK